MQFDRKPESVCVVSEQINQMVRFIYDNRGGKKMREAIDEAYPSECRECFAYKTAMMQLNLE